MIKNIYENIEIGKIINKVDGEITNFTTDTRKVNNNSCYIAILKIY